MASISAAAISTAVVAYMSQAFRERGAVLNLMHAVTLFVLAAVTFFLANLLGISLCVGLLYFVGGCFVLLWEATGIMREQSLGPTLLEKISLTPREIAIRQQKVEENFTSFFQGNVTVYQGDSILAVCDSLEDGRAFARRFVASSDYATYIVADHPAESVLLDTSGHQSKIYYIDCFIHSFGFGEFKEPSKGNIICLHPVTIRRLHEALRKVRRMMVSQWISEKHQYGNRKRREHLVAEALSQADLEQEKSLAIVYDPLSSMVSLFTPELILNFLTHDLNVDKVLERNTLLLVQSGVLEPSMLKRLESLCDIVAHLKAEGTKKYAYISKAKREQDSNKEFEYEIARDGFHWR
jgi:hypothetical protein